MKSYNSVALGSFAYELNVNWPYCWSTELFSCIFCGKAICSESVSLTVHKINITINVNHIFERYRISQRCWSSSELQFQHYQWDCELEVQCTERQISLLCYHGTPVFSLSQGYVNNVYKCLVGSTVIYCVMHIDIFTLLFVFCVGIRVRSNDKNNKK